jgi:hypothetical protein
MNKKIQKKKPVRKYVVKPVQMTYSTLIPILERQDLLLKLLKRGYLTKQPVSDGLIKQENEYQLLLSFWQYTFTIQSLLNDKYLDNTPATNKPLFKEICKLVNDVRDRVSGIMNKAVILHEAFDDSVDLDLVEILDTTKIGGNQIIDFIEKSRHCLVKVNHKDLSLAIYNGAMNQLVAYNILIEQLDYEWLFLINFKGCAESVDELRLMVKRLGYLK